jgi:hypothetical protein
VDEEEDYSLPVWAGVLPLQEMPLPPIRDALQSETVPVPAYVEQYSRQRDSEKIV